jgi:hypothetical protein
VDRPAGRDVPLDAVDKAQEFLVSVALHVSADGRAFENVVRAANRVVVTCLVIRTAASPRVGKSSR